MSQSTTTTGNAVSNNYAAAYTPLLSSGAGRDLKVTNQDSSKHDSSTTIGNIGNNANVSVTSSDPEVVAKALDAQQQLNSQFITAFAAQSSDAFDRTQALLTNQITQGQGVLSSTGQNATAVETAKTAAAAGTLNKTLLVKVGLAALAVFAVLAIVKLIFSRPK